MSRGRWTNLSAGIPPDGAVPVPVDVARHDSVLEVYGIGARGERHLEKTGIVGIEPCAATSRGIVIAKLKVRALKEYQGRDRSEDEATRR